MDDDEFADVIPHPSARPGVRSHNELEARLDELTVRSKPHDPLAIPCRHRRSALDIEARRIYCRECKVEVDPYDVLDRIVRDREREVRQVRSLRLELDNLRAQVKEAERQERNAKARIRRVRSKRGDEAAILAAAEASAAASHRFIPESGYYRDALFRNIRVIIEAYHEALSQESPGNARPGASPVGPDAGPSPNARPEAGAA